MSEIRKKIIRIISVVLAAAMIGASGGMIALAAQSNEQTSQTISSAQGGAKEAYDSVNSDTVSKDETVYIICNTDGSTKKIIVSDHLENSGSSMINDISTLDGIKNVKGDESFTQNGDKYVWQANGSDIYYQGISSSALPVDMRITYLLDGKEISPGEISGKSGRVTIRFDYTNNEKRTVTVDGKETELFVPFLMVTGTVLDNSRFTNITVTNGKLINDGDRSAVLGFAMPGMQENLDIDKKDFEVPDYVEISADVKDFELVTCMTVSTTELFSKIDTGKLDTGDIDGTLKEFSVASQKLMDGTSDLYDGISTLFERSAELADGTQQLADGTAELKSGAGTLSDGASRLAEGAAELESGAKELKTGTEDLISGAGSLSDGANELNSGADKLESGASELEAGADKLQSGAEQLNAGTHELYSGLGELSQNSGKLNEGAKQVFDTMLGTAETQIKASGINVPKLTIQNYKTELNKIVKSLDKEEAYKLAYNTALEKVTASVNANESAIKAKVEAAVKQRVLEGVLKAAGLDMNAQQYQDAVSAGLINSAVQVQVNGAVEAQINSTAVKKQISDNVAAQKQLLIEQNMKSSEVTSQINGAVTKAQAGQKTIQSLIVQLDSYNQFYMGLKTYTDGVDSAYSGSGELAAGSEVLSGGAKELKAGASELYSGTKELKNGTGELVGGTGALLDGASSLDSGAGALKNGTNTLKNGADDLSAGAEKLYRGAAELDSGAQELNEGVKTLIDGISQLKDGAGELNDGMKQFNDDGVQKLINAVDGDVAGLLDRIKATVQAGKAYDSFSGKTDGMNGSVKFIYRTEAIEKAGE